MQGPGHPADYGPGGQPLLRRAPLVCGVPLLPGQPQSEYYIWHDPAPDGGPPNNWASVFGGSAWEFEPRRGPILPSHLLQKQPDLNWACKALREELLAMMDWWAQRGVDGFRVDAISYLEKPQGFPDSPLPPQPDGYSLFNNWAAGSEGTHRYIRMMHDRVFGPRGLVTVGEVSLNAPEEIASYVDPDRREFTMAIPFVPPAVEIAAWSPKKLLADACRDWRLLGERGWWARFLSNHDKPRQVSLYGSEGEHWEASAKLLALLVHTLPGTPFLYQGEELGMTNMAFSSIEEYNDPEAKNRYRQLLFGGRPPERGAAHHPAGEPGQCPHAHAVGQLSPCRVHHRHPLAAGQPQLHQNQRRCPRTGPLVHSALLPAAYRPAAGAARPLPGRL